VLGHENSSWFLGIGEIIVIDADGKPVGPKP